MLKAGIHARRSSNWKAAVVVSNWTQRNSDSSNVIIDVHRATLRAFRLTTSASPPGMARMNPAPTRGRKVTRDRIGNSVIAPSARLTQQVPGDQEHDTAQHGKGVMVKITALQTPRPARQGAGRRRHPVGTDAVDQGAVAGFP